LARLLSIGAVDFSRTLTVDRVLALVRGSAKTLVRPSADAILSTILGFVAEEPDEGPVELMTA
jgi:hypothetical protein